MNTHLSLRFLSAKVWISVVTQPQSVDDQREADEARSITASFSSQQEILRKPFRRRNSRSTSLPRSHIF